MATRYLWVSTQRYLILSPEHNPGSLLQRMSHHGQVGAHYLGGHSLRTHNKQVTQTHNHGNTCTLAGDVPLPHLHNGALYILTMIKAYVSSKPERVSLVVYPYLRVTKTYLSNTVHSR